jgi:hypothetical protein
MSGILIDILDRLSGVAVLKDRVNDLAGQLADMRRIAIEQQKSLAELRGQVKALIQMQSQAVKK